MKNTLGKLANNTHVLCDGSFINLTQDRISWEEHLDKGLSVYIGLACEHIWRIVISSLICPTHCGQHCSLGQGSQIA